LKIAQLEAFRKEVGKFPLEIREDVFILVDKFLKGERLNTNEFKTFKIDKDTKIQEFKVKDYTGNWRAISCIIDKDILYFVYAFHKKSQALLDKDKDTIRKRIKRIKS
jgi:phage-related protein